MSSLDLRPDHFLPSLSGGSKPYPLLDLLVLLQPLDGGFGEVPLTVREEVLQLPHVGQPRELLESLARGRRVVLQVDVGQRVRRLLLHAHDLAVVLRPLALARALAKVPQPAARLGVLWG